MHEKFLGLSVAQEMHKIFKDFFHTYEGEVVVHNYGFESKFMMHKYVMSDYKDYRNMNKFIRKFKWGDTMLMAYALLNSTERTPLGLKDLAKDRYGDWDSDIDVKNALGQDIEKLCYYNAIDVSATLYIRRRILADISPSQLNFYETVMKDTQNLFTRIMVTGLPIDMQQVLKGEEELLKRQQELQETFYASSYVKEARDKLVATMVDKYNETHKKQIDADFYESIQFNYSSSNQLRVLLFDIMGYTPVELTKTKQASTAKAVIEELLDATQDESMKEVLQCLIGFSEVEIILSTFLRAMREDSIEVAPGVFKLYGNLRVGGTQTFRPTASAPNLLNVRAS
jgi:DNA polymerase-1